MALSSRTQIKYGALISYGALGINILAALLYTPWIVREIGQANYGLFSLATSLISLFLVDFGISAALARFLTKYRAENRIEDAKNVLGATYSLYIGIDIIILVALAIVYFNLDGIYRKLTPEELSTFKILFLIVGVFNLISFPAITLDGILNSYEKFIQIKICDLARKLLSIIFVVLALWLHLGIVAVVASNVIAGLITIIIKLFIIRATIPIKPSFRNLGKGIYKSILSFSVWMTIISFAQKFVYNIAPTILGIVAGAISISIYAPASSLGSYYFAIAAAINGLFLPHVSRKVAEDKVDDIQLLMEKMGRFQMILLSWIFVCFVCIGRQFMVLWMGSQFELSYYCTILVFMPAMFEYAQQIGGTLIIAQNKVKYQAIGFSIISIVTICLSFVLGRYWGAIGVCISICLAGFANVCLQSWIFSAKLGLDMSRFRKESILPMLAPSLAVICIGWWFASMLEISWYNLIIEGIVISCIYALSIRLFVVKQSEIGTLIKIFKK